MTAAASEADGIIFDCDGVLVDVADSYGAAIIKTVSHVLDDVLGLPGMPPITPAIIQSFKDTGGFNNEIDLAYAAILLRAAAGRCATDVPEMADMAAACPDIAAAEQMAASTASISDIVERLAYPSAESIVGRVFDQLFYGPVLYRKVSGMDSDFSGAGLIEQERLILDRDIAGWLPERFGSKVGMVTGRGYESARHTLGGLLDIFNPAGSVFLEDEPRSMAKPNPEPLASAIDATGMRHCVYVGDSAEDLMMARAAASDGRTLTFIGIYGSSASPQKRLDLFRSMGADHMVRSIADLPKLLNFTARQEPP